jgi:hypothetical protein
MFAPSGLGIAGNDLLDTGSVVGWFSGRRGAGARSETWK